MATVTFSSNPTDNPLFKGLHVNDPNLYGEAHLKPFTVSKPNFEKPFNYVTK